MVSALLSVCQSTRPAVTAKSARPAKATIQARGDWNRLVASAARMPKANSI